LKPAEKLTLWCSLLHSLAQVGAPSYVAVELLIEVFVVELRLLLEVWASTPYSKKTSCFDKHWRLTNTAFWPARRLNMVEVAFGLNDWLA